MQRDNYPDKIEFEIDREAVCRYWQWQGWWLTCFFSLGLTFLIGAMPFASHVEHHHHPTFRGIASAVVVYFLSAAALGALLHWTIYLCWVRRYMQLSADHLRLFVDGAFLRVISGAYSIRDRRIHFREVSDYSTIEDPRMHKFGLKLLTFRVKGGREFGECIPGLTKADLVCNQLCEIDAAREG